MVGEAIKRKCIISVFLDFHLNTEVVPGPQWKKKNKHKWPCDSRQGLGDVMH